MFALLLAPLTIVTLMSGSEIGSSNSTDVRLATIVDTVPAKSESPALPSAMDTSIPMLNLDMVKRLGALKKELALVSKKNPELGGGALGIAMQSRSFDRFEKSAPFTELAKKHGFTVKQFFSAYSEVVGGLFILNVEKQLNQTNLTEAQGFKVIPPNKNFIIKNRKLIDDLKLGETYVGERPRELDMDGMGDRDRDPMRPSNPMNPQNPMNPMNPSNPMDM